MLTTEPPGWGSLTVWTQAWASSRRQMIFLFHWFCKFETNSDYKNLRVGTNWSCRTLFRNTAFCKKLLNSSQKDKVLELTKLKAIGRWQFRYGSNDRVYFWWIGKQGGKRRKCWLPAFSPFPILFIKAFPIRIVKTPGFKKINIITINVPSSRSLSEFWKYLCVDFEKGNILYPVPNWSFWWRLSKTMPLWFQYGILKIIYRSLCKIKEGKPY